MKTASRFVVAIVVGISGLLALPRLAIAEGANSPGRDTTVPAVVQGGDEVIITSSNAQLMVGNEVLARLPHGRTFSVTSVQGPWLGTSVQVGARSLSGWVMASDVLLVRTEARGRSESRYQLSANERIGGQAQSGTVFRLASAESVSPVVVPANAPAICVRPSTSSLPYPIYDNYWSGHHEPDPDIHTWEPWRHRF